MVCDGELDGLAHDVLYKRRLQVGDRSDVQVSAFYESYERGMKQVLGVEFSSAGDLNSPDGALRSVRHHALQCLMQARFQVRAEMAPYGTRYSHSESFPTALTGTNASRPCQNSRIPIPRVLADIESKSLRERPSS
jgi:hypothetical protein